ncbi:DUF4214 domain-containing protein [Actinoplanes sp. CA-030573]|uniref:DUF4214 domain-containing protein n=1 Tax=Actinoplanes sp. CA-030573 TaxID=3239898 RepID=UPI003D93AD05
MFKAALHRNDPQLPGTYWVQLLDSGQTREDVLNGILGSDEYRHNTEQLCIDTPGTAFTPDPDPDTTQPIGAVTTVTTNVVTGWAHDGDSPEAKSVIYSTLTNADSTSMALPTTIANSSRAASSGSNGSDGFTVNLPESDKNRTLAVRIEGTNLAGDPAGSVVIKTSVPGCW